MTAVAADAEIRFTPWQALGAQVGAEIKNRARSTGSLVALFVILIGSYWAIPPADGKAVSVSWTLPDGRLQAPLYTAGYLGIAMSVLGVMFFALAAFYLVAGAVRQDRERGIGLILAATPISKSAYLGAKWLANTVYLVLLSLLCLPVGVFHFMRSGVGAFDAVQFLAPLLLMTLPAAAFVAAGALLFDVTPVLRSKGGLVIWFFFGAMPMMVIPMQLGRASGAESRLDHVPAFDPLGMAMHESLVQASLPPGSHGISSGYVIHDEPIERAAWAGLSFPPGLVTQRLLNMVWVLLPFLGAVLLFDRFDPSRYLRVARASAGGGAAGVVGPAAPMRTLASLGAVEARPSALGAVLAETRLLWETGGKAKWLVVPAALVAALLPAEPSRLAAGAFVLLVIPLVSEVGCREDLAGARPLVLSQPGVPSSAVLWKFAAVALFLLAVSLPITLRGLVSMDARAYAVPLGMLFVAAFAVGSASLSRGGKLFSGVLLLLWYLALNGLGAVDFCGALARGSGWETRLSFLAIGAAFIASAMLWEKRRLRGV